DASGRSSCGTSVYLSGCGCLVAGFLGWTGGGALLVVGQADFALTRLISATSKRRWPRGVRVAAMMPRASHLRTVSTETPSIRAASPIGTRLGASVGVLMWANLRIPMHDVKPLGEHLRD